MSVNIGAYLGVVYIILFVFVIGIVLYYAEPGFPWHTYITLTMGYFCSFGILLLVPIDIAAIFSDRKSTDPSEYQSDISVLGQAYYIFFTIILVLGSAVLVFEEYYNTDGES